MKTTMYAHIEVLKNGKWLHYSTFTSKSDDFFHHKNLQYACINGIDLDMFKERGGEYKNIVPAASYHGIPHDATDTTKACLLFNSNEHAGRQNPECRSIFGECMLNVEDLEVLQDQLYRFNPKFSIEKETFCMDVNGRPIVEHAGFDDVRVICWFAYDEDNAS